MTQQHKGEEWSCKWCGGTNENKPLFGEVTKEDIEEMKGELSGKLISRFQVLQLIEEMKNRKYEDLEYVQNPAHTVLSDLSDKIKEL